LNRDLDEMVGTLESRADVSTCGASVSFGHDPPSVQTGYVRAR
jgi:hypothetical protein